MMEEIILLNILFPAIIISIFVFVMSSPGLSNSVETWRQRHIGHDAEGKPVTKTFVFSSLFKVENSSRGLILRKSNNSITIMSSI